MPEVNACTDQLLIAARLLKSSTRRHEDATRREAASPSPRREAASPSPTDGMPAPGTEVCWEDKVWLQHFPLSRQTVLDYFSNSPVSPALTGVRDRGYLNLSTRGSSTWLPPCNSFTTAPVTTSK